MGLGAQRVVEGDGNLLPHWTPTDLPSAPTIVQSVKRISVESLSSQWRESLLPGPQPEMELLVLSGLIESR